MIVVDSSILVAASYSKDIHHGVSSEWIKNNASAGLATPTLALCEVSAALSRRGVSEQVIASVLGLIENDFEILSVTDELIRAASKVAVRAKTKGADSIFIAAADSEECGLATLDKEQADRGALIVQTDYILLAYAKDEDVKKALERSMEEHKDMLDKLK